MRRLLFLLLVGVFLLNACQPSTAPASSTSSPPPPPTASPTPLPPSPTPIPPTATFTPVPSPTPGPGRIVFTSNREEPGKANLYILDPENEGITLLPTGLDLAIFPRWSPDGQQVLFAQPDVWHLYTITPDGSNRTQITDFRSNNADWSPDGTKIVFQSDHRNEPKDTPDIYVLDLESGELTEILDAPETAEFSPRWSPDGSKILFISNRAGNDEIFVMNPDGSGISQITHSEGDEQWAEWSPDGTRIVYSYAHDLYIINADGDPESVVRLTSDGKKNMYPAWSPDGKRIVFSSNRSGNWDLWVINADGSGLTQLTDDTFIDVHPHWGP